MLTPEWRARSADEKADILRQEFDAFFEAEKTNFQARTDRSASLERRIADVEAALIRIEEKVARMASQFEGGLRFN